jgi:CheY-like chemotaxis protein
VAQMNHSGLTGPQSPRNTVLVVDHDPVARTHASAALRSAGFPVLEVADGTAALAVLHEHSSEIWLVLIAGFMPGMSGPELATRVAAKTSPPQILLTSAYPPIALRRIAGIGTEFPVLQRPFTREQLIEYVRQILKRKRRTPRLSLG